MHNLSRALDTDARLARLEERSRHVQINDETLCDSCHARLGTKLFAMYPDDTVVCYKVDTVTISFSWNLCLSFSSLVFLLFSYLDFKYTIEVLGLY